MNILKLQTYVLNFYKIIFTILITAFSSPISNKSFYVIAFLPAILINVRNLVYI